MVYKGGEVGDWGGYERTFDRHACVHFTAAGCGEDLFIAQRYAREKESVRERGLVVDIVYHSKTSKQWIPISQTRPPFQLAVLPYFFYFAGCPISFSLPALVSNVS